MVQTALFLSNKQLTILIFEIFAKGGQPPPWWLMVPTDLFLSNKQLTILIFEIFVKGGQPPLTPPPGGSLWSRLTYSYQINNVPY